MTSYDTIAEIRPRIRRDVLFTQSPAGVIFHDSGGGFSVNAPSAYRLATLVVPHLTGEASVAAMFGTLSPAQREKVSELIAALYQRGYVWDAGVAGPPPDLAAAVATRFAAQLSYVDHYCHDNGRGFERFRQARIAVTGDDVMARSCVLGLIRNGAGFIGAQARFAAADEAVTELTGAGCAITLVRLADGDLTGDELAGYHVVLICGERAEGTVLRLLAAGLPAGTVALPAWRLGDRALIGPVMEAGAAPCWACALLRLGANGYAGAAADAWSAATAVTGTAGLPPLSGALSAMLGNLLAYEAFRLLTRMRAADRHGELTIQHVDSLDVRTEPVLPHPACRFCAGDAAREAGIQPDIQLELLDVQEPAVSDQLDGSDADDALAELDARQVLVQPGAGVFSGFDDDRWTQLPVKVSGVTVGIGHTGRRTVAGFDLHHVAGARLRALNRAALVYAEHVIGATTPAPGIETAPRIEAAPHSETIGPELIGTASGVAGECLTWLTARSLIDAKTYAVPAGAVHRLGPGNDGRIFEPTPAGLGAGESAGAATRQALASALRYAALRAALSDPGMLASVRTDREWDDPELTFLLRSASRLNAAVELLALGTGQPMPVYLARALDASTGTWRWAVGGDLSARRAAVDALTDLIGAFQLAQQGGQEPDLGDPLLADLDVRALVPARVTEFDPARQTTWAVVLKELAAAGQDALVVPVPAPDLAAGGISVTRVLLTRAPITQGSGDAR